MSEASCTPRLSTCREEIKRLGSGTVLQDDVYTWSQDPAGHPNISSKSSTTGQGTGNVQTAYSTQTLDQYGNTTAVGNLCQR
jgi:hypothetical protein